MHARLGSLSLVLSPVVTATGTARGPRLFTHSCTRILNTDTFGRQNLRCFICTKLNYAFTATARSWFKDAGAHKPVCRLPFFFSSLPRSSFIKFTVLCDFTISRHGSSAAHKTSFHTFYIWFRVFIEFKSLWKALKM